MRWYKVLPFHRIYSKISNYNLFIFCILMMLSYQAFPDSYLYYMKGLPQINTVYLRKTQFCIGIQ
jgi:hypothetical protein